MTHVHAEAERNIRNAVAEMHSIENEGGNEIKNNEEEKQQMSSSRVQNAVRLFESGYNCAQSVFAAYADLFGMDTQTALKMSSAMGAGVGRMREVCGVVSSMAMLAGLKEGNADPNDEEAKAHIYGLVRLMSAEFKKQHETIICKELLGIEGMEESARPSVRTPEFYASRPCRKLIAHGAEIIEEILLVEKKD